MQVEVDISDVTEKKADNRGRITLGSDYADKTVTVAVIETNEESP